MSDAQAIQARSEIDRLSVGRAHRKCFEMSLRFLEELEVIALNPEEATRDRVLAMRLVLERTLPTLQRVQHSAVVAHLPLPQDAASIATPQSAEESARAESIRLLREIRGLVAGNPSAAPKLGLVLLRSNGTEARP